ncbi:MAG: 50S ribosomal protein L13 [Bacilli bacterium]|nr:50S ribosomal protein L13 [Bacilli bacterium]
MSQHLFQRQTTLTNIKKVKRNWHLVDVEDAPLGRIAVRVSKLLMGKNKICYTPNVDCGDYVVLVNAKKVFLSGNKEKDKKYYNASGFPSGLRVRNVKVMRAAYVEEWFKRVIRKMMRKNRLSRKMLRRLFIFPDEKHNKAAQNPIKYVFEKEWEKR